MVFAEPGIAVLLLLACGFLMALAYAYKYTFGAAFLTIINAIKALPRIPLGFTSISFDFLAAPFELVDNAIRDGIGTGVAHTWRAFHVFWHYSAYAITKIGAELEAGAAAGFHALESLRKYVVPSLIAATVGPLLLTLDLLKKAHKQAVTTVPAHVVHTVTRVVETKTVTIVRKAVALPLPRISALEREIGSMEKRVRALAKALTPAAVVALIGATIFKTFKLGWLRCPGVNRVGRGLCGMTGLIESVAADALDVILATHLCQMATLMTKGARAAEPAFDAIIGMTSKLIQCQGAARPKPLVADWHEPPSVVSSLTL